MTWDEYISFLSTPRKEMSGMPICPYVKHGKYHIMTPEHDLTVVCMSGTVEYMRERARAWNGVIGPDFYAIPLHPDDPFNVKGCFTRASPEPAMVLMRAAAADRSAAMLRKTHYYDEWSEDNLKDFPGLEHLP